MHQHHLFSPVGWRGGAACSRSADRFGFPLMQLLTAWTHHGLCLGRPKTCGPVSHIHSTFFVEGCGLFLGPGCGLWYVAGEAPAAVGGPGVLFPPQSLLASPFSCFSSFHCSPGGFPTTAPGFPQWSGSPEKHICGRRAAMSVYIYQSQLYLQRKGPQGLRASCV